MMLRPGSVPWLLRHELRLGWRRYRVGARKWSIGLILGVVAVVAQLAPYRTQLAAQLDTKIGGVPRAVFVQAFQQAKEARLFILDKITQAIPAPRENLSLYAPRIFTIQIEPEQIGLVIGPGGKTIKKITADTGAKIDIEQDGTVYIASVDGAAGEAARKAVEDLTRTVKPGDEFEGTVVRFLQFGAFVELMPGKDGLLHISQIRARPGPALRPSQPRAGPAPPPRWRRWWW